MNKDYIETEKTIKLLKLLKSQTANIIIYIIQNTNEHYQFLGSYEDIHNATGAFSRTIMLTFKTLKEAKLITSIKKGIWEVNLLQTEN